MEAHSPLRCAACLSDCRIHVTDEATRHACRLCCHGAIVCLSLCVCMAQAALVRRRPLIGLWGGVGIYYHDERLPFCGHNQYMRLGSAQGQPVSYVEGTHDNRQVCRSTRLVASATVCLCISAAVTPMNT